jgi:hypothetical protein
MHSINATKINRKFGKGEGPAVSPRPPLLFSPRAVSERSTCCSPMCNFLLILVALMESLPFYTKENRKRGCVSEQRGRKFGCARDDKV